MLTLSNLLVNSQTDSMTNDSGRWRQFILDHLDYIALRSQSYSLSPEVMNQYQYNLGQFLSDNLQIRLDTQWIVLLLNNWGNDFEFVNQTTIIVPSDDLITNLYKTYRTINNPSNTL